MILGVDIGNSNIVLSVLENGSWEKTFRYETHEIKPELYYEIALRNILLEWNISSSHVAYCVVSSVVPDINQIILEAVERVVGCRTILLNPEIFKKLDIHVPHPYEIGSDLVSNAYAGLKKYFDKVIIVDFGTAISFTIANRKDGIIGVTLAPGLKTALNAMSDQTAQLPLVPIQFPDSVIGFDTVSAIQSGVLWGFVGLVKEIIKNIKLELDMDYKVIATGGLSSVLHPLEPLFDAIDKNLTLDGMMFIADFEINS